jgi:YegS/Rv2252/BmrU family lipid kinase
MYDHHRANIIASTRSSTDSASVPRETASQPTAMTKQALVVLNPGAGSADSDSVRHVLAHTLGEHSWTYNVHEITGDDDVAAVVRAACNRGVQLVIAAGGDGTVSSVVNGLWQTNACLGIVPLGTGNILARAMAIPDTPKQAMELIVGAHAVQPLDAMRIGDQTFVLNVSVGLSARAMRDTRSEHKRRFGILAYVWTMARDLVQLQPRHFNLTVDGRQVQVRASEILVANGTLLQKPPFPYGSPEGFNDQQLDVYILTARTLVDYLRLLWGLLRRSAKRQAELRTLRFRTSITIDTLGRPQPVQADGEWIGQTPVTVELAPSAIRLIVPPRV